MLPEVAGDEAEEAGLLILAAHQETNQTPSGKDSNGREMKDLIRREEAI